MNKDTPQSNVTTCTCSETYSDYDLKGHRSDCPQSNPDWREEFDALFEFDGVWYKGQRHWKKGVKENLVKFISQLLEARDTYWSNHEQEMYEELEKHYAAEKDILATDLGAEYLIKSARILEQKMERDRVKDVMDETFVFFNENPKPTEIRDWVLQLLEAEKKRLVEKVEEIPFFNGGEQYEIGYDTALRTVLQKLS